MSKKLLLIAAATLTFIFSFAQPAIQWQKSMGGAGFDEFYRVRQTADGGYIASGYTTSANGDFSTNPNAAGTITGTLVKFDALGNVVWQTYILAIGYGYDVLQTIDGGYIYAGSTILVKTDASGNVQWRCAFPKVEVIRSAAITNNGD